MLSYFEFADALRKGVGSKCRTPWRFSETYLKKSVQVLRASAVRARDTLGIWWNMLQRRAEAEERVAFETPVIPPPADITTTQPRLNSFLSLGPRGFHRVSYTEWGAASNPHVVMCLHGFARNGRDFDVLARCLAQHCRVVCMDVVGRGNSDWLEHKSDYDFPLYLSDVAAFLARITAPYQNANGDSQTFTPVYVDWLGTSMGGLIGMLLAAKSNTLIRRLILNDSGPAVSLSSLWRMWYLHGRQKNQFRNLQEMEAYLRSACRDFGPIDDEHWDHVIRHSSRQLDDGSYMLAYDPGIMRVHHARNNVGFGSDFLGSLDLWPIWDRIRCPTLVLRGAESDVLLRSTAENMKRRGPRARVVEFAGVGHAPWLMSKDQIDVVSEFVLAPDNAEP